MKAMTTITFEKTRKLPRRKERLILVAALSRATLYPQILSPSRRRRWRRRGSLLDLPGEGFEEPAYDLPRSAEDQPLSRAGDHSAPLGVTRKADNRLAACLGQG